MLKRLYINHFRCFENFELNLKDHPSALLIGKNGTGKSALLDVLQIFQNIGRGTNRVGTLVRDSDIPYYHLTSIPIRLELEVLIRGKTYEYILAFERPENFKESRVLEEKLTVEGRVVYSREVAKVTLYSQRQPVQFLVDWHLIALPIIQEQSFSDPLRTWKDWLSRMVLLAPIPDLMNGESRRETLHPNKSADNISDWLTGLLSRYPASYSIFEQYLKAVLPDFADFRYEPTGKTSKDLIVGFRGESGSYCELRFADLSSGEKIFFLGAAVLAANRSYDSWLCFWDEPDNYLSLSEVGHFIVDLRKSFQNHENDAQIIVTSHNPEAIQRFSRDSNIWILDRKSHSEPAIVRKADEIKISSDLITSLMSGDLHL